jgi:RNA polymerase sigma-70 factor, ECF subfamily
VDELEDDQRKSILLAYYGGLTHEQLAARLAAPLGTVKSWIRRGLQRLKRCLEP